MQEQQPTAAILIIGNEILSGRTQDANINYIARALSDIGIALREVRVVRDEPPAIIGALNTLRNQCSYVFTTGGIGPTHDDITMQCVADAFGVKIYEDEKIAQRLTTELADRFTPASLKMARFPEGAELIETPVTVAPGCRLENVFVMAGIPKIMQAMLQQILPRLQSGPKVFSKSVDVFAGESTISAGFEEIQSRYDQLDLGSYPFRIDGKAGTSLVVRGTDESAVTEAWRAVEAMLDDLGVVTRG